MKRARACGLFLAAVALFACGGTLCFACTVMDVKKDVAARKARADALLQQKKYEEAAVLLKGVLRDISPVEPTCLEALQSLRLAADKTWTGDRFVRAAEGLLAKLDGANLDTAKYRDLRRRFLGPLAVYYFDHRQVLSAIEVYEQLLMISRPGEIPKIEEKLAQCYEEAGYAEKALAALRRRLAHDPENISLRRRVVRLCFRSGRVDEGLAVMGEEAAPTRIRYMAQQLFAARYLSEAEALAVKAAEKDPVARSLLGKIYYEQKRFDESAQIFAECFAQEKKNRWVLFDLARRLAESHSRMGVLEETIAEKEENLRGLKDGENDARLRILILLSEMKKAAADLPGALEAYMEYRKLVEKTDRHDSRLAELGRRALGQLLSDGKLEEAESLLGDLRRLGSDGAWLDCALYQILVRAGREDESAKLLSKLESTAGEARIYSIADEFGHWEQSEICERLWQRILETKPDNTVYDSNAHVQLGKYYCHKKKFAEARAHFDALDASLTARNVAIVGEESLRGMEAYMRYRAAGDDPGVLMELLGDPRPLRCLAAARLLGRFGRPGHIEALEEIMSSSAPGLKAALEESVTCIRARAASGLEETGGVCEDNLEAKLARFGNVLWVEKDPFDEGLRWAALEKKFIAAADLKSGEIVHFTDAIEVLSRKALSPTAIVFTEKTVWVGTDHGLFAFERRTRTWSEYAVGGELIDVRVRDLGIRDGLILVTVDLDGRTRTLSFDPGEGRWKKKRERPFLPRR